MFGHLYDYVVWNSCNVCTSQCAVGYVDRVADACCDDLGVDAGYVEDLNDFTDQINAAGADVIESSKEWGNISCTCSCSQKCLVCGEDQGYVCLDALCAQNFNSFESSKVIETPRKAAYSASEESACTIF